MIDPNQYVDGVPLTPFDVNERIAKTLADADEHESKAAKANTEKKKHEAAADEKLDEVREIARLLTMKRPIYALVDGTITSEPPRVLPLWEALERSKTRAVEQATKSATVVGVIHTKFGEGRADGTAFLRRLDNTARNLVLVQTEEPGKWVAFVDKVSVDGGPWRSAADAMIAALEACEFSTPTPELLWEKTEVVSSKPKEEPAEVPTTDESGQPKSAPEAKASKSVPAAPTAPTKTYAKGPDDGQTFRAAHDGKTYAVAQTEAPGPWHGYQNGSRCATGLDTAADAKAAVEAFAGAPLTWASKLPDDATKVDTTKPPARRTRVAK